MGSVCTGALIVVEQAIHLTEYEVTGIELDCKISSQVLVNIFEHNTPLHDGAVIIRGNRITSATCYLPLSDNMQISKELGTRHRAALGMSEVCDALVIAVSEETGQVSVAMGGQLERGVSKERLTERLNRIQYRSAEKKAKKWKGWRRNEKHKYMENLSLKVIALFFAVFLWLIVINIDDPVDTQTFDNIPVEVKNEQVVKSKGKMYQILDGTENVSVKVTAKREILEKLTSSDFSAVADMQEMQINSLIPNQSFCKAI